jgi:hypothetical protein
MFVGLSAGVSDLYRCAKRSYKRTVDSNKTMFQSMNI